MAHKTTTYFAKNLRLAHPEPQPVLLEALGNGSYAVTVDGQRSEVHAMALPQGAMSMILDGASYNVEFEAKGDQVSVLLRNQVTRLDLVDEQQYRLRAAAATFTNEGTQVITSPMPGKVVKVFVKVGDKVTEGQPVVVVEAMKMENELKSPKTGTVTEVTAKEGTAVENGTKLVVVE
jgi:biotin carboxyl carrier protein